MSLNIPEVVKDHPAEGPWWPSPWGATDERGAMNLLGPAQVRAAAALIRTGTTVDLGFPFLSGYPDFHHRDFVLASAGGPSGGPVGAGRYCYNDEVIAGRFTGMSTHFNALVHVGQQLGEDGDNRTLHYYNGYSHAEIGSAWGFKRLGIEKVLPVFAPGVLLDLAGLRGGPWSPGEVVTREDLLAALDRQQLDESAIAPGTVVFWRLGNDHLYFSDPERYVSGAAGIRPETADWLADRGVILVGADAIAMEPIPPVDDRLSAVHGTFLCHRGVHIIVNLNLQELADRQAWRFAFACAPIPFAGAQGSPVRPLAIL